MIKIILKIVKKLLSYIYHYKKWSILWILKILKNLSKTQLI